MMTKFNMTKIGLIYEKRYDAIQMIINNSKALDKLNDGNPWHQNTGFYREWSLEGQNSKQVQLIQLKILQSL